MRFLLSARCVKLLILGGLLGISYAQSPVPADLALKPVDIGPTGIEAKRPVFAGACKACPWGALAAVTQAAMKPYGFDVRICWVCWSSYGPREMADKTKPVIPPGAGEYPTAPYVEPPPNAVPDISATSELNLLDAWNGEGAYAADHKQRRNYRIVAMVQQPNYLIAAASKRADITDLSQVKDRRQPTWIGFTSRDTVVDQILEYYGITEDALKAKGGGFVRTQSREQRAAADVFLGGVVLVNTPEQRMWYEASQLNDLIYFDLPAALLAKLEGQRSYVKATAPIALLRGMDRPVETLMRSTHVIYVRDDAPESFSYAVAKALDEHQDLFRMYADPFWYDPRLVAASKTIPLAAGALHYYRDRGYVK